MSVRLTARRGAIPEPDGQVGECLWDSLMRLRRETRKTADGPVGVHTSAPGFRPRIIVLGSLWFPDALRFLGDIGRAALLPHHGEIGSNPELADLGG